MNKNELITQIAEAADISKTAAGEVLEAFKLAVINTLKKGDKLTLTGFGTFSRTERAAREGKNPQTGKTINIAAKNVAKFKAGKYLADAVK